MNMGIKEETPIDNVVFLKHKEEDGEFSDVFAFFPELCWNKQYKTSYVHIGQHSDCSIEYALECSPATQDEYRELKEELETHCGYRLNVLDAEFWLEENR